MKKKISLLLLFLILPFAFLFSGCDSNTKYHINFIVDEQVYHTIETTGNEYITLPNNPEKDGYVFVGWYLDKNTWQEEVKSSSFSNENMEKNINVFAYFRYVENPILATSISLNQTQLNLELNEQQTLTASILPDNVTSKSVVWTSSNINIATVNNGLVKAINYGTAIITAKTNNNLTATCQVNVVDKSQNVQVEVYIDGQVVETLTTNATNDYKITAPQKPEDITTNPNAERYFYGWFVDSNYQTPLTEDRTFLSNGKIYGKWIDIYTSNFAYSVSKGKATITLFTNTQNATVVVVPCYVNSFPVERIGTGAFINQTMLRNVIICDGIEYLDESAFYGCNSMQSIQLPNTLKEIETNAFENCELLTKIDFPNTLSKIGSNAFKNCGSLSNANFNNVNWWLTNDDNYIFESFIDTSNSNVIAENLTTIKNNKIWINYTLYTINYNLNNGILPYNAQMYFSEYTTTFDLLNPQKKGYDFAGYYGNNNFSGNQITQVFKGTNYNVTIFPKYSLITYTITYSLNGGINSIDNPIEYNVEMEDILLYDATKEYYDFESWTLGNYVVLELNINAISNIDSNKRVIELTANYTPTIYNITYVLNGGTNSENNPATYTIETPTITLSPATFENEPVSRWYTESQFANRIKTIPIRSHGDITIYARAGYDDNELFSISDNNLTAINNELLKEFAIERLTIPNTITKIINCKGVANNCIKEIIVPNSVKSIDDSAFYGFNKLKSITLPFVGDRIKKSTDTYQYPFGYIFGTKSYTGCYGVEQRYFGETTHSTTYTTYCIPSSLTDVTITGGDINFGAFYNCDKLSSITITNYTSSIYSFAFLYCSSLSRVDYKGTLEDWCKISFSSYDSNPVYYAHNLYINNQLVENIEIPNTLTEIKGCTFSGMTCLKSVTIPNSVTTIGESAFKDCKCLSSITIGNSVTSIDKGAFEYCSSLTDMRIPDSVSIIGQYAFRNCNLLKNVIIGNSVTTIEYWAFMDCRSLINLTIGESVTTIGAFAFGNCESLTSVTIPKSITTIAGSAFQYCYRLVEVYNLSSLQITKGSTDNGYVGYYAKVIHSNINEESIIVIDKNNFQFCWDEVEKIGYCIGYNGNSTNISIPSTFIINGQTKNVKVINDYAFYNCSSLTDVIIPNSISTIGTYAYSNCDSLISIEIPNLISISAHAFSSCDSLISLTLGKSVKSIGSNAFEYCDSLCRVDYKGTLEDWCKISFSSFYSNPVYCAHNLYINNELVENIEIPNTITEIKGYAFSGMTCLKSVTIPNSVKTIEAYAFYGCVSLTSVVFNNTDGWSASNVIFSSSSLGKPQTAATYLRDKYASSTWTRKD